MASTSNRCQELSSPSIVNFAVSCFILCGILVSYLPQHIRIIRRRSSEGLSPYFVLLGTTSGTCAIANILVLPTSREDIACCTVNGAFSCAAGLLGIAQIGVQWSCFFLITLLFLAFIPRHGIDHRNGVEIPLEPTDAGLREAVIVVATCIVHFIVTFIISIVVIARFPDKLGLWANVLGILCATLASIQYVPQIWTTWRLQRIGSLSIPMMCIQTPGSFVFAASLAVRLGKSGWSAWAVYLVTGTLQGCLLTMAIMFEWRERRERTQGPWETSEIEEEGAGHTPDIEYDEESSPLLGEQAGVHPRRFRYADPDDNPLAPHRLNPDPDSSPGSFANSLPNSRPGSAEVHNPRAQYGLKKDSWFHSLTRSKKS